MTATAAARPIVAMLPGSLYRKGAGAPAEGEVEVAASRSAMTRATYFPCCSATGATPEAAFRRAPSRGPCPDHEDAGSGPEGEVGADDDPPHTIHFRSGLRAQLEGKRRGLHPRGPEHGSRRDRLLPLPALRSPATSGPLVPFRSSAGARGAAGAAHRDPIHPDVGDDASGPHGHPRRSSERRAFADSFSGYAFRTRSTASRRMILASAARSCGSRA